MEVELAGIGDKRKALAPLIELDNMDGNRKLSKMEGGLKEMEKLLTQNLGSMEAGYQPRPVQ